MKGTEMWSAYLLVYIVIGFVLVRLLNRWILSDEPDGPADGWRALGMNLAWPLVALIVFIVLAVEGTERLDRRLRVAKWPKSLSRFLRRLYGISDVHGAGSGGDRRP